MRWIAEPIASIPLAWNIVFFTGYVGSIKFFIGRVWIIRIDFKLGQNGIFLPELCPAPSSVLVCDVKQLPSSPDSQTGVGTLLATLVSEQKPRSAEEATEHLSARRHLGFQQPGTWERTGFRMRRPQTLGGPRVNIVETPQRSIFLH